MALSSLPTTSHLSHLGDVPSVIAEASIPTQVRHVEVAGEALTRACVERVGPKVTLWNNYGPTEASVDVTGKLVSRKELSNGARSLASIGTPYFNVQCFVV